MKTKKIIFVLSAVSLLYGFTNLIFWNFHDENYMIKRALNCQKMFEFTSEEYKACAYHGFSKITREENYGRLFTIIGVLMPIIYLIGTNFRTQRIKKN